MWGRWLKTLTELLIPTRCQVCQQPADCQLCAGCASLLEPVGDSRCVRCGRRRETTFASPDCSACYGEPLGVSRARSVFVYNQQGRKALAEFKFNAKPGVGEELCRRALQLLPERLADLYAVPDLRATMVVPVPLHPRRLRSRKFNQSQLVAQLLGRRFGLEVLPSVLRRTRDTQTQVGLSAPQRKLNVRGAFSTDKAARGRIANRDIVLVDDLMTTGATLAACARELKRGGSGLIYGFTLFSTHFDPKDQVPGEPSQV